MGPVLRADAAGQVDHGQIGLAHAIAERTADLAQVAGRRNDSEAAAGAGKRLLPCDAKGGDTAGDVALGGGGDVRGAERRRCLR